MIAIPASSTKRPGRARIRSGCSGTTKTPGCHDTEMTETQRTVAQEIEHYLRTGESDPYRSAWSGSFLEREERAYDDLRKALAREVRRLTAGLRHELLPESDTVLLTRAKVEPMVRGLFPRPEQDLVLALLERSVVFVTGANIESLLLQRAFDSSAWNPRTCTSQALARSCSGMAGHALSA